MFVLAWWYEWCAFVSQPDASSDWRAFDVCIRDAFGVWGSVSVDSLSSWLSARKGLVIRDCWSLHRECIYVQRKWDMYGDVCRCLWECEHKIQTLHEQRSQPNIFIHQHITKLDCIRSRSVFPSTSFSRGPSALCAFPFPFWIGKLLYCTRRSLFSIRSIISPVVESNEW